MTHDITVVIPTIPPRANLLRRALRSVTQQTLPAAAVVIEVDNDRTGAPATRHRGLCKVTTEWAAFLDDDDVLDSDHLATLRECAEQHHADYVWSRFRVGYPNGSTITGPAPLGPGSFAQWDDAKPAQTTITTLVRTDLAVKVGGFDAFRDDGREINGERFGEDFDFTLRMRAAGAVFRHAPAVTWTWMHHGYGIPGQPGNTSGLPDRW